MAAAPSASYRGNIQISSATGMVNLPVVYTVSLNANGDHDLSVTPMSFALATSTLGSTNALGITPPSWDTTVTTSVEYPAGSPSGWLPLMKSSAILLQPTPANLLPGVYSANIRVHGSYPSKDV